METDSAGTDEKTLSGSKSAIKNEGMDIDSSKSTKAPAYQHFPGRVEWEARYPTENDVIQADISQCPAHLRHHFQLMLLDAYFVLPTLPYTWTQHKTYVSNLMETSTLQFNNLMEKYVQGPGGQYWIKNANGGADDNSQSLYCHRDSISTLPVPTAEPELGSNAPPVENDTQEPNVLKRKCSRLETDEPDSIDDDAIQRVTKNLQLCEEWVRLEKTITTKMLQSQFVAPKHKSLMDLEDAVFHLAATPDCTVGVFYLTALQIEEHVYIRFIESGQYKGCFKAMLPLLCTCLPDLPMVWWEVYNTYDMQCYAKEWLLKRKKWKARPRIDKAYYRFLDKGTVSVTSAIRYLVSHGREQKQCQLLGTIVQTVHPKRKQKVKASATPIKMCFFHCEGAFQASSQLIEAQVQKCPFPYSDRDHHWLAKSVLSSKLTLGEQCDIIGMLPNRSSQEHQRFESKFSVSVLIDSTSKYRSPHSTRNRVLWAFFDPKRKPVFTKCLQDLFAPETSSSPLQDIPLVQLDTREGASSGTQDVKRKEVKAVKRKYSVRRRRTMRAAQFEVGGPEKLFFGKAPMPEVGPHEVLIQVVATAINRADTLQRMGKYKPPPGSTPVLGLEAAGYVHKLGAQSTKWQIKDRVMALLIGGGNAEYAAVHEDHVMLVPDEMSFTEAGSIPEVWLTAYQLLHLVGHVQRGDWVLIHAGASGIGTAAVQLSVLAEARPLVTAGSSAKLDMAVSLGAEVGFNYKEGAWADKVIEATGGHGADVILDCVGGSYWEQNVAALAVDGRWVQYGLLGGGRVEGDLLSRLLQKRGTLAATLLRPRPISYKSDLVAVFVRDVLPLFADGRVKTIIDRTFPIEQISDAHALMESNAISGKIVLIVREEQKKSRAISKKVKKENEVNLLIFLVEEASVNPHDLGTTVADT